MKKMELFSKQHKLLICRVKAMVASQVYIQILSRELLSPSALSLLTYGHISSVHYSYISVP